MGSGQAKQYLRLHGRPILAHTLQVFQESRSIDEIILVVPEADIKRVRREIVTGYGFSKISLVLPGGRERQDSVRNGLEAVGEDCRVVVVHDGVRPFPAASLLRRVVTEARRGRAAIAGVPAKDTVKRATPDGLVLDTLERRELWLIQTPQAFPAAMLKEAFRRAYAENHYGTDEASLVERAGYPVVIIPGDYRNIKITTPEDLEAAKYIACGRPEEEHKEMRVGCGYDSHRLVEGRRLVLGGVDIPFERGLLGHSDADALLHAVCDALLGAIGGGDIGMHFPDTDPAYRNIDSLKLLEAVAGKAREAGCLVRHVDATIILERPKLAPYLPRMAANIARTLDVPGTGINLKAKTNEGMGFIGRGEGIAVMAVVTVVERERS